MPAAWEVRVVASQRMATRRRGDLKFIREKCGRESMW
jgi:hypothetical protein